MKSLNRALSILTASCLIAMQVCAPVYAAATASDADYTTVDDAASNDLIDDLATSSDADPDFTVIELSESFENGLSLLSSANDGISLTSSITTVSNTVDYDGVSMRLAWVDSGTESHLTRGYADSNGYMYYSLSDSDLGEFDHITNFRFTLSSDAIPSAGNYSYYFDFTSDKSVTYKDSFYLQSAQDNNNVARLTANSGAIQTFIQNSGDLYAYGTITIGNNVRYIEFCVTPSDLYSTDWCEFGGYINIRFVKLDSDADTDYTTAGGSYSSTDAVSDTASNTASIASSTADMADTLKEIVQTISNQLAALWDQMYNYMHLPQLANDDKNTQAIIDKLGDDLNVEIQNQDQNFDELIENDNANTQEITRGFDASVNDSTNDSFSAKSDEYDAIESEIFDTVSEPLESFTYDDYSFSGFNSSVLNAMRWVSDEFMELFNGMGDFNVPITCSLVLIVVTTLIGYYRIRAGG